MSYRGFTIHYVFKGTKWVYEVYDYEMSYCTKVNSITEAKQYCDEFIRVAG